jgi:uncharacterized membrane protein
MFNLSFFKLGKDLTGKEDNNNSPSHGIDLLMFTRFICHRIPERTFNIRGHYFPVCSRCTGFYIGAFTYFVFVYFFYVQYTLSLILLAFLMMVPTFYDGLTQLTGSRESNNILRLSTGLMGGVGLAILVKTVKWLIIMG